MYLSELSIESLTSALIIEVGKSRQCDDYTPILPSTIPDLSIKGFDSLTVLEVLTDFEKTTGLYFNDQIFYDPESHKMRAINEIVSAMFSELFVKGKQYAKKQ